MAGLKLPPIGPGRFLAFAGLLLGLAFAASTPPLQVPDEPAHLFRAVALSEGAFATVVHNGERGAWLPSEVVDFAGDTVGDSIRTGRKADLSRMWEHRFGSSDSRRFVAIPSPGQMTPLGYTAAQYTPVAYLADVASVAVSRGLGAPIAASLYAGRILNLIIALAILTLAVSRMPYLGWATALLALTPMAAFMRSSLSPDGLATALAFLFIAEVARMAAATHSLRWKAAVPASLLLFLIGVTKPNVLLVVLLLVVPKRRFAGAAQRLGFLGLGAAAVAAGLLISAGASDVGSAVGQHSARQIAALAADPALAFRALFNTWLQYLPRYLSEFVGKLGWLEVHLPTAVIVGWYAAALYVIGADGPDEQQIDARQRVIALVTFLACSIVVLANVYLTWSGIGSSIVDGAQGRYFIPFAPALAMAIGSRRWSGRWVAPVTAAAVLIAAGASMIALMETFW